MWGDFKHDEINVISQSKFLMNAVILAMSVILYILPCHCQNVICKKRPICREWSLLHITWDGHITSQRLQKLTVDQGTCGKKNIIHNFVSSVGSSAFMGTWRVDIKWGGHWLSAPSLKYPSTHKVNASSKLL